MIEALIDHLWQSTVFLLAAALLTLLFRRNRADIRFHIWLAASVKFLVPFPLLVLLGEQLRWHAASTSPVMPKLSLLVGQLVRPAEWGFPTTPPASTPMHAHWSAWALAATIWVLGIVVLAWARLRQLRRLSEALAASAPLQIQAPIPVRETSTTLEPGIVGIFPSILLLPAGIAAQLAPEQLQTIIAHELCHWRRKDNLTAAVHMLVETLFWFHPLVWWVGGKMLLERERACDEEVIETGSDRQTYAEGILKVCRSYVEAPLPCVAGVSGGSLRKRIEDIMTNQVVAKLHVAKRGVLMGAALAAILGPVAVGFAGVSGAVTQAAESTAVAPGPVINGVVTEMKRYHSQEWHFSLEVPKDWNTFPPVSSNSPLEVIRFESRANGYIDGLIVFRGPRDPNMDLTAVATAAEQPIAKGGFSNFVMNQTKVGSHQVVTLDFDRPANGGTVSSREYFFSEGSLLYVLGFGTSGNRDSLLPLYDRMVSSFVSEED